MDEEFEKLFEPKKPSPTKKIVAIVVIVAVVMAGLLFVFLRYQQYLAAIDLTVEQLLKEDAETFSPEEDWVMSYYEQVKNTGRFQRELNTALPTLLDSSPMNVIQLSNTAKVLDMLGYDHDNTKVVIDNCYLQAKQEFEDASRLKEFIEYLSPLRDLDFYSDASTFLSTKEVTELYAAEKSEALSSGSTAALYAYAVEVQAALQYLPHIAAADLLAPTEILDIITAQAVPAIFVDGAGGYYDFALRCEAPDGAASFSYYGDFMIKESDASSMRFRGKALSADPQAFLSVIRGGSLNHVSDSAQPAAALAVFVDTEEDFLCIVKSDGIVFLSDNSCELSYDAVSTAGYDVSPERSDPLEIPSNYKLNIYTVFTVSDIYKQLREDFLSSYSEMHPSVTFHYASQQMFMVLTAPEGTAAALKADTPDESWEALCSKLQENSWSAAEACEEKFFDVGCVTLVVSDEESGTILFAARNGEEILAKFE
ncbi:MAG: hypothetical protein J6J04_02380 [Oscillospiraceae bacterium]|nr:hypothetical protein [Oscillospiraceae bacterium]